MYVKITFSNNWCGCDETQWLKVKSMQDAEAYAEESLFDYAQSYEYLGHFEEEEEIENYYADCDFYIEEIEKEEFLENNGTEL